MLDIKRFSETNTLLQLAVSILWMIWKARNKYIFNSVIWNKNEILSKALFEFNEFIVAKEHVNTMSDASTNLPLLTLSSEKSVVLCGYRSGSKHSQSEYWNGSLKD